MDIQPNVKIYLETLLQEAVIKPVNEAERNRMVEDLYSRLDEYTSLMLLDKLSAQKQEEFSKKREGQVSQEELESFLKQEIPNVEDVFKNIFLDFRNLYLGREESKNL